MKTLKYLGIVIMLSIAGTGILTAQHHNHNKAASTKTETFKVYGNCESCKARIEKAAKIEGVFKAEWNKDTKLLTLVFDPTKAKSDDVQKKIAAVGHDTEKYKADDKTYNSLPSCCKYDRKK